MSVQTPRIPAPAARRRLSPSRRAAEHVPAWSRSRWPALLAVALITLLAVPLHLSELHFHYWVDEGISVGIAGHPLAALPDLLRQDGSPPLYYALLHVWMQLFGRGEVATHLLSVGFAIAAVPVAYWAVSGIAGRLTGVYAALLTAGLPFLVTYAQETRMYSLILLLSLIVAGAFVRAFALGRRRWAPVFSVALATALYTHNWALFLTLAALAALGWCVWSRPAQERRRLARDGALAFAGAAVLYLPWAPTLLYQATHTGAPWASAPTVWSLTQGTYGLTGGRATALVLLLVAGHGLLAGDRRARGRLVTVAVALAALGFGTLLIAWLYAKASPAWAERYLAVIAGPLIVLFAIGLRRAARFGAVGLALVCLLWITDPIPTALNTKSNVATAAAAVRPALGRGSLVLSTQPEQVPVLHYYLPAVRRFLTPLGAVPDPGIVDWRNALTRFAHSSPQRVLAPALAGLAPGQTVALVLPDVTPRQPQWSQLIRRSSRTWRAYLDGDRALRFVRRTSTWTATPEVAGVHIVLYRVR
ncbi:MAG TPA: glycosyltransferase family 39 protein [Solirubrobacteraceae bacterium]|nr:glycosyltransferase family 39 protein [Solirubrobacteraceae bacterium]